MHVSSKASCLPVGCLPYVRYMAQASQAATGQAERFKVRLFGWELDSASLVSLFKCSCKIEENLHEKSQEEDLLFQKANVSSARMLAFFFASQWLCGNRHSEKASCKVKALST